MIYFLAILFVADMIANALLYVQLRKVRQGLWNAEQEHRRIWRYLNPSQRRVVQPEKDDG